MRMEKIQMKRRILWLDNDVAWTKVYRPNLEDSGYEVIVVSNVTDAISRIKDRAFSIDLFILDVMIPTQGEQEEKVFKPELTDKGKQTGVLFYELYKQHLQDRAIPVLIMTARIDESIPEHFKKLGFNNQNFFTRNSTGFLKRINEILSSAEN